MGSAKDVQFPLSISTKSAKGGSNMKFRPLHDRVLVSRVEQDDRTVGGIIIPDTAQEKPMEGGPAPGRRMARCIRST
jgi:hypothetical protein